MTISDETGGLESRSKARLASTSEAEVCGIVVLFFPEGEVTERLSRICEQVDLLIVVVNGWHSSVRDRLLDLEGITSLQLIENESNVGVAEAFNRGAKVAKDAGFEWILLMDQDSIIEPHLVATLFRRLEEVDDNENVALVAPNYTEFGTGRPAFNEAIFRRGNSLDTLNIISSGSLLRVSAWEQAGGFRSELFIDLVDFEFCLRLRQRGLRTLVCRDQLMIQPQGELTARRLFGKRILVRSYSPLRDYYRVRNGIFVCMEYLREYPRWCVRRVALIALRVGAILLIEDQKIKRLRQVISGLLDGWRGHLGAKGTLRAVKRSTA